MRPAKTEPSKKLQNILVPASRGLWLWKNPLKQWKVSPVDKQAQKRWKDYSEARNVMLLKTNFKHAPWFVVNAEEKKPAHVALISHLLKRLKYRKKNKKLVSHNYGLVYPATPENINEKLY